MVGFRHPDSWFTNGIIYWLQTYGIGYYRKSCGVLPGNDAKFARLCCNAKVGDHVDLHFEMDTLVLFHTCPHPMNDAKEYPKKAIRYQFYRSESVADDDICRQSREENQRGFKNTALYNELHT